MNVEKTSGGFIGCCLKWDILMDHGSKDSQSPTVTYNKLVFDWNICDTSVQVNHLYPVTRGTPLFFQMTWGLGLPPTWHSNTTLPPSSSFWTVGTLIKKGSVVVACAWVKSSWDTFSSLTSSVTLRIQTHLCSQLNCSAQIWWWTEHELTFSL